MCDVMGALMLGSVFFQASGSVTGKRSRGNCTSNNPQEQLGRLLAIGVGSILLSGIPGVFLGSMHTRSFKKFEYEGCPEWDRQLRSWRIQDRMIWFFGLLYTGFCVFFIMVFLANISPADHHGWAISGIVSVVEDTIVIPFCVALFVPVLATLTLHFVSCAKKVEKQELIRQRRQQIHEEGILTLPVVSV